MGYVCISWLMILWVFSVLEQVLYNEQAQFFNTQVFNVFLNDYTSSVLSSPQYLNDFKKLQIIFLKVLAKFSKPILW